GVLPFPKAVKRVLVAGDLGNMANTGDAGSSNTSSPYVVTPLEGLRNYFGPEVEVLFFGENNLDEAAKEAAAVDCVIIVAGNDKHDEGEHISPAPIPGFSFAEAVKQGYENL